MPKFLSNINQIFFGCQKAMSKTENQKSVFSKLCLKVKSVNDSRLCGWRPWAGSITTRTLEGRLAEPAKEFFEIPTTTTERERARWESDRCRQIRGYVESVIAYPIENLEYFLFGRRLDGHFWACARFKRLTAAAACTRPTDRDQIRLRGPWTSKICKFFDSQLTQLENYMAWNNILFDKN